MVADGPCDDVLADADGLAAHSLELPAGFDLASIERRARPAVSRFPA